MHHKLNILVATIFLAIARFLVKVPTLVIWGAEGNLISVKRAQLFSKEIKDVKVEIIPKARHMPRKEKSERVNSTITDFVKD